jgi:flagellin
MSGLVVKNNLSALNTLNVMNSNTSSLNSAMKKVSSGMKINGAKDDASGYQISERMRVQIRSLDQANQNTQNGSSLLKTAEGAVSSTVEILKTLKEKVLNAANGTNTENDLAAIQDELDQSIDQINDNASVTFNDKYLVDGSMNKSIANATSSAYTNSSLSTETIAGSALTGLLDRNGNNIGLVSGDTITVTTVVNGKTSVCSTMVGTGTLLSSLNALFKDGDGNTLASISGYGSDIGKDSSGYTVSTATATSAVTISGVSTGIVNSIGGFTIGVTNRDGETKKDANKILDSFTEQIKSEDKSNDNQLQLQVGTKSNQTIKVALSDMGARALGLQGLEEGSKLVNLNVTTTDYATAAINVLDSALQKALSEQTKIGAIQSRLEYTADNLTTSSENVTNAESTIRDADMAKEMTEYNKYSVLQQASQAMLAQANQSGQGVLSLLQ